jgi:hypothetical protein
MRERADLKSPVREYRSPGSVRGAPGNRRPYLDNARTLLWQTAPPRQPIPPPATCSRRKEIAAWLTGGINILLRFFEFPL